MTKTAGSALSPLRRIPQHAGRIAGAALALALIGWLVLPAIPQNQAYHQFADQRQWLGVQNAADVLSNLAFALVGIFGMFRLVAHDRDRFVPATEVGLWCIALGILATALGSAWYHHDPSDPTLFWDRLPMTLVFAGVLGATMGQRLSNAIGRWALGLLIPLGFASVLYWKLTGDLSLYLVVQFGGVAALAVLLAFTQRGDDPIPWAWVVIFYVVAKGAEMADGAIWDATSGVIAGHAVKHLLAAAASAVALWPLFVRR